MVANSDSAYLVAAALRRAGLGIVAVIDRRAAPPALEAAHGLHVITGAAVTAVSGRRAVRGCSVSRGRGRPRLDTGGASRLRPDPQRRRLCARGAPALAGGRRLRWLAQAAMFVPDGAAPGLVSVGACAGVFARATAVEHAAAVGEALAHGRAAPARAGGRGRALADDHARAQA